MTDIKPGDLVVCVNDKNPRNGRWMGDMPKKGNVYTVRGLTKRQDGDGLLLEEITSSIFREDTGVEVGFWERRFRPIDDSAIDVLREIAANPPKELVECT